MNKPGKKPPASSGVNPSTRKKSNAQKIAEAQRKARIRTWGITAAAAIAVVGGSLAWNTLTRIDGVTSYAYVGSVHQQGPITYEETPPAGGPHHPAWFNCGVYSEPVVTEQAVHSLEHGAVWITYRPDLPEAQVRQLEQLVDGHSYTLLSPFPGLPAPVVISAWNRQLRVQSASDPRLAKFLDRFEQGSQAPERGAPCVGGTSGR